MQILEMARQRKDQIESELARYNDLVKELRVINKMLAGHGGVLSPSERLDGAMTLSEAVRGKAASVRLVNAIAYDSKDWLGKDLSLKEITLSELKQRASAMTDAEMLRTPNFGRKSLNELKLLLPRII